MKSSKPSRREMLQAAGMAVSGLAVAAVVSPPAAGEVPVTPAMATELWLLDTGKRALDPEEYERAVTDIRARYG